MIKSTKLKTKSESQLSGESAKPSTRRTRLMNIEISTVENVSIIRPQSDIDSFNVSFLKDKLRDLVDNGCFNIIMDLEKVRFMDSAALGILVSGMKTCMQNSGTLGIINPSRNVENLFRITHLDSVFSVFPNEDEAIKGMSKNCFSN